MLRDYQIAICEKVNKAFKAHRSVMLQMPTGTGKTVVLASLVNEELRIKNEEWGCANVLIVAHRIELIAQIGEHLKEYGIGYGVIAGGRKEFMTLCDKEQKAWEAMKKSIHQRILNYDAKNKRWQLPEGSVVELCDEKRSPNLYHIIYKENGESKEFWIDRASGFTYRHRPVTRKRGFLELLYDGEVVYILNILEERFMPYHNWEIRADERICTIGNKLYFSEEKDKYCYRIKRRSDDFRMFVVEERYPKHNSNTIELDEFIIINEAGKELEIK